MTTIQPGNVVLVPFPFTDLSGQKKRPAVVLAVVQDDLIVAAITGNIGRRCSFEYLIRGWRAAGLLRPSAVRPGKLFTIHRGKIKMVVGSLLVGELDEVWGLVKAFFHEGHIVDFRSFRPAISYLGWRRLAYLPPSSASGLVDLGVGVARGSPGVGRHLATSRRHRPSGPR